MVMAGKWMFTVDFRVEHSHVCMVKKQPGKAVAGASCGRLERVQVGCDAFNRTQIQSFPSSMSPNVSSTDISQAILQHVEIKAYPDSDELASAELDPAFLSTVLDAIGKERDTVKVSDVDATCRPFLLMPSSTD